MSEDTVKVRIAPSPTGYVHVGTARTAIFNWLFARHFGGQFLVRIEDTDATRSKPEFTEAILSSIKWLGLQWDGEVLYQSQRIEHHKQIAQQILDSGHGYRCFCTQEQLQQDREEAKARKGPLKYNRRCLGLSEDEIKAKLDAGTPYTVRIKIPDGETRYDDMVSGELVRQNSEIEDFIVARSDGTAVYNLAVVVDDHDMEITHVIRGNDHVTNTFKQLHIYSSLGWTEPKFGHVPLILRKDKRKVSKRLGDKDVVSYREEGILPEALFNFLSLLGWSSKTDREIYSVAELVEAFTPNNFNASNAIFDPEKLLAFNREHISLMSDHDLAAMLAPLLVADGCTSKYWLETRWEYLRQVAGMLKSRATVVSDLVDRSRYFFTDEFEYDEDAAGKHFDGTAADRLLGLADRFEKLPSFEAEAIETSMSGYCDELEVKKAKLIHPTRLAVSGMPVGPSLYEMLQLLGREATVLRMRRAADTIKKQ